MSRELKLLDETGAGIIFEKLENGDFKVTIRVYMAFPDHVWTGATTILTQEEACKLIAWLVNNMTEDTLLINASEGRELTDEEIEEWIEEIFNALPEERRRDLIEKLSIKKHYVPAGENIEWR